MCGGGGGGGGGGGIVSITNTRMYVSTEVSGIKHTLWEGIFKTSISVLLYLMLALVSVADFHFHHGVTSDLCVRELDRLLFDVDQSLVGGEGGRV